MNSSRRLRLASVSRSVAWSDFFSNADPTSAPDTKPARGSVLLRLRCEAWLAIGPESDRVALQPSQLPASAPQLRPVACVQACAAPARIGPCACAAPKSFWPNPHSQKSGTPNAPENSRLRRRPIETYGANHPHRVSPSLHSPQSLAINSLHYCGKCASAPAKNVQGFCDPAFASLTKDRNQLASGSRQISTRSRRSEKPSREGWAFGYRERILRYGVVDWVEWLP